MTQIEKLEMSWFVKSASLFSGNQQEGQHHNMMLPLALAGLGLGGLLGVARSPSVLKYKPNGSGSVTRFFDGSPEKRIVDMEPYFEQMLRPSRIAAHAGTGGLLGGAAGGAYDHHQSQQLDPTFFSKLKQKLGLS